MPLSVSVNSVAPNGTTFTIAIAKTGSDTVDIKIITTHSGVSHTDPYEAYDVRANATKLTCMTTVYGIFHPTVTCEVDDTQPPGAATVIVTVANAPAYNGATNFQISTADGAKIKQFIAAAAFPKLGS